MTTAPLSTQQVQTITNEVYRRLPELKGIQPVVTPQAPPQAKAPGHSPEARFLLTYTSTRRLPDGTELSRIVRVVASAQGDVIKISTSR